MSLNPEQMPEHAPQPAVAAASESPKMFRAWQGRLLHVCFAIFTFEVGLFLVIFPWMDSTWRVNYFQAALPALRNLWEDPYFRGALTGLGLVNIYIACLEIIRTFRKI